MAPLHPAVVHFPIALGTLSVVADGVGVLFNASSLIPVGWWALVGGSAGAAIAVLAGRHDMNRERIDDAAHRYVHTHMKVGYVLLAVLAGLTFWRWRIQMTSGQRPGWGYLLAGLGVLGLTLFQGWLGGELTFAHGVGVALTGQGTEPTSRAQRRLAWLGDEGHLREHQPRGKHRHSGH